MSSKRRIIFPALVVLLLAAISAWMMVIGRGHTVYLDNKTLEDYNGQSYPAFERVVVTAGGEKPAKLGKRDRGQAICIGQTFRMTLEITGKKGDDPVVKEVSLKLPYSMDGIIINLPAYLAGLPEEAWLTEFIPAPEKPSEEELPGEDGEFGLDGELGLDGGLDAGGI